MDMHSATVARAPEALGLEIRSALRSQSIALVGMMGSGKSAVGHRLATKLDMPFADADIEIVEAANGMLIPEIFEKFGEAHFRSVERKVIARLLRTKPLVLATGGGAFMNPDTRAVIRTSGISIWLRAELPILLERIIRRGVSARPMLRGRDPIETLKRLIDDRYPTYGLADLTVDSVNVPHEEMISRVLEALRAKLEADRY